MEIIVTITALIYMVHKGLVDIKMWSLKPDQQAIREKYWYLITDFTYLAGTAICFLLLAFTTFYADMVLIDFARYLFVGALIGDEIWDLLFGYVIDQDALYPFKKWYNDWGFDNKTNRILFDTNRILLAVLIYTTTFIK